MGNHDAVRKAAAIAFCDMVDFSELSAIEGDLVAANILRAFIEHADKVAKEHNCLTMKFIGDAFLATFDDVSDALALISSTQALAGEIEPLPRWRLTFKFGLNFGDVVFLQTSYGPDVFGEEVNVAAHLTELAQPHQIVVAQAAFDRLPREVQARAGASESQSFKRAGPVHFRRVDLRVA